MFKKMLVVLFFGYFSFASANSVQVDMYGDILDSMSKQLEYEKKLYKKNKKAYLELRKKEATYKKRDCSSCKK